MTALMRSYAGASAKSTVNAASRAAAAIGWGAQEFGNLNRQGPLQQIFGTGQIMLVPRTHKVTCFIVERLRGEQSKRVQRQKMKTSRE